MVAAEARARGFLNAESRRARSWLLTVVLLAAAPRTVQAAPPEAESNLREASRRFQRGVTLYAEADYRAALGEFRRAYSLAPSTAALYDIGETEYQLQDYAGALTSFERYLASTGRTESRRAEVEADVEVLRTRVGYLTITSDPPGADLTVDDLPVGKAPLEAPLRVSIGRRKVLASLAGGVPVTRYVDVAADDHISLTMPIATSVMNGTAAAQPALSLGPTGAASPPPNIWATLRPVGWITSGALAAGSITFAILASKQSSELKDARHVYPTTVQPLRHDARVLTTYSVLADSFGAAAVIVAGLTLYSTVSAREQRAGVRTSTLSVGLTSLRFEATF